MIENRIDGAFLPIYEYVSQFQARVRLSLSKVPFTLVIERHHGYNFRFDAVVYSDDVATDALNQVYAEKIVKTLMYMVGGYRIHVVAPLGLFTWLKSTFSAHGARRFDVNFMEEIYNQPLEWIYCLPDDLPKSHPELVDIGGDWMGNRVGFDAGGSDMKVVAVQDGNILYQEEIIWHPKVNSDASYHRKQIEEAMTKAASHLNHVDRIGVSSAGIIVSNQVRVASLFIRVPKIERIARLQHIYTEIAQSFGASVQVANDGDVAAFMASRTLKQGNLLGIALGTSQAAGYINPEGKFLGWLWELAFVPAAINADAAVDEWSCDSGVGAKYHSQDAMIRLAEQGGITFDPSLTPAEKLKHIADLAQAGSQIALDTYHDVGVYLGYSLVYYHMFVPFSAVMLMGRVTSGVGGASLIQAARDVLLKHQVDCTIHLPDENDRRLGQALAAAYL
ncbi:MAG: ROK family protein [Candidatus Izemoplasmatales bacterium]|nr:ROK family protein [Candidatus Izemoplasmatales bacterium]